MQSANGTCTVTATIFVNTTPVVPNVAGLALLLHTVKGIIFMSLPFIKTFPCAGTKASNTNCF
jgi:hypothetical protein